MIPVLTNEQQSHFLQRGFSRRSFGRIAALIGAGTTLPFYNESAMAQLSQVRGMPADAVKINANENPLGPCAEAIEAIHNVVKMGGRYSYELTDEFQETLASQSGVKPDYVRPFAGSSAPLHQAALGFTSPTKSFIMADPGYESGGNAAKFIGAKVIKVPLDKNTYAHDVKAMAAADPNAGLIYICNPNNPSGTLTPDSDIDWLVENKPAGAIILLDEAYTHISGARLRTDLVAKDKDIVILRTFSKIYGMAGLRAGAAIGRPDLLAKITPYSSGALPITGMAGATASLKSATVIPERRKIMGDTRNDVQAFFDKHGIKYVPSVSNKIMVDVGKPGDQVIMALRKEKVYIGRIWPVWPTHVRVSIGTPEEMAKFKTAFVKVMAA
ncbi:MAG: pyridoxal phosphate-dependent aminotransferase [Acidobacteriia bacterium]|nr:pyridoxal phosphate-dependent aminotransferase [Terriglobia bacterium]